MELKEKILTYFEGKVVRKDLASIVKGNLPVPTYVVEYLLAQYCALDDEQLIAEGIEKVKEIISDPDYAAKKYPAARVQPETENLYWFIDVKAAQKLTGDS